MEVPGEAITTARTRSGVLSIRIPVSLHSDLAVIATKEGVSMNYLIGYLLTRSVAIGSNVSAAPQTAAKEAVPA